MTRGLRIFILILFSLTLLSCFFVTGCTRYANEEQLTTLDETEAAAESAEKKVSDLEAQRDDLKAKLAEKKEELRKVQEEKEKVRSRL